WAGSGRVLAGAPSDVALWVRRHDHREASWTEGPIVAPFGGAAHDWAALELAAWLAHARRRPLHILGAVRDQSRDRPDASRLVADAGLLIQRITGVVPHVELVLPGPDGVSAAVDGGGLLVIGLFDNWAHE